MNLKKLRIKKELTQIDLAKLVNVSQQCISMWENGERMPSMKQLLLLAKALECEITDFFEKE